VVYLGCIVLVRAIVLKMHHIWDVDQADGCICHMRDFSTVTLNRREGRPSTPEDHCCFSMQPLLSGNRIVQRVPTNFNYILNAGKARGHGKSNDRNLGGKHFSSRV
jgi:hypothetical protein